MMEKLLNLLNEYKEGRPFKFTKYDTEYWMFETDLDKSGSTALPEETIICKKFWFIKWLVENDKIIKRKIREAFEREDLGIFWPSINRENTLIMYLSIQDNPIAFLISILK